METKQIPTTDTAQESVCLVSASIDSDDMNENDDYFDDDDTLDFDAMASTLEITEQNFLSQQQQQEHQHEDVSILKNSQKIMDTYNDEIVPTQVCQLSVVDQIYSLTIIFIRHYVFL
jgi:hypothetical protein